MAENAPLISDAVSHCVRGYWAVTHALRRQPQPTGSAAGGGGGICSRGSSCAAGFTRTKRIIDNIAGMAVFYVAGYLIEERHRWPVITASPRGQCSK